MSSYLAGLRIGLYCREVTTSALSRRRALQLLGLAGGAALLAPALAACGSSGGGNALAGNAPVSGRFEGITLKLLVNQPHVTSFRDVPGPGVGQGHWWSPRGDGGTI